MTGNGVTARSEAPAQRKPPATATPFAYCYRASRRLYNFFPESTLRSEEAVENSQLHPPPTILFFRHHPDTLIGDGKLTSSLQSLESSFFLIALSRFPHALTVCYTAIETAIRASGIGGKSKINPLSFMKRTKSEKIAKYPRKDLEGLEQTRNRFIHQGFTSKDDTEATSLLLEVGLPFLWLCYKELHSFDAVTGLLPEYWDQLDAAKKGCIPLQSKNRVLMFRIVSTDSSTLSAGALGGISHRRGRPVLS